MNPGQILAIIKIEFDQDEKDFEKLIEALTQRRWLNAKAEKTLDE